jgi:hypothetical protein
VFNPCPQTDLIETLKAKELEKNWDLAKNCGFFTFFKYLKPIGFFILIFEIPRASQFFNFEILRSGNSLIFTQH